MEYRIKDSAGNAYVQPSVSHFDGIVEATEKTMSAMVSTAAAVGLALVAALATSARGSENILKR